MTHAAVDTEPAWGSDGAIAFTSRRAGNLEIDRRNGDGIGQTRLTHNAAEDLSPHW